MSPQLLGPVSSSDTPGEVLLSDSVHDRSTTTLVIIFPGSGSHHIGFWNNQALCMSYGTRRGSLLECVEWCHSRGFGVMILHWTRNFTNSGRPLKGSHTPEAHVKSAWDWVMHSVCFSHLHTVLLLGHSLGGSHIFELLRERHHQMRPLLAGIALADSVHQRNQITSLPQAAQQLISETCVHWVASDEPQGALLTMASKSCRNISAGDPRHHDTIVTALDSMLAYLEKRQLEHRKQRQQLISTGLRSIARLSYNAASTAPPAQSADTGLVAKLHSVIQSAGLSTYDCSQHTELAPPAPTASQPQSRAGDSAEDYGRLLRQTRLPSLWP